MQSLVSFIKWNLTNTIVRDGDGRRSRIVFGAFWQGVVAIKAMGAIEYKTKDDELLEGVLLGGIFIPEGCEGFSGVSRGSKGFSDNPECLSETPIIWKWRGRNIAHELLGVTRLRWQGWAKSAEQCSALPKAEGRARDLRRTTVRSKWIARLGRSGEWRWRGFGLSRDSTPPFKTELLRRDDLELYG